MKKTIFQITLLLLATFVLSCKKESSNTKLDYTKVKISQIVSIVNSSGYRDTSRYTYSGDNLTVVTTYGNSPSISYISTYTKSGNQYLYTSRQNTTLTHEGFIQLNAQGFEDTARITNVFTAEHNNRNKNYYTIDGLATRNISRFSNYENDVKLNYTAEGNYSYWIYDVFRFDNPSLSTKDSIVFEYYTDKPFTTSYSNALYFITGKSTKDFIKKRRYYDLKNSGNYRRSIEYDLVTDSDGLVTRVITRYLNQPGDVQTRVDTSYISYIK